MAFALAAAAGCAGDDQRASVVTGTIAGRTFAATSAVAGPLLGRGTGTVVLLTDAPDACAALKAHGRPRGSYLLFFKIYEFRAGQNDYLLSPTGPGSYQLAAYPEGYGRWAEGFLLRLGTDCKAQPMIGGQSGTVVVDRGLGGPGPVAGSFDASFTGGRVQGSFDASWCDAMPDPGVFSGERDLPCAGTPEPAAVP